MIECYDRSTSLGMYIRLGFFGLLGLAGCAATPELVTPPSSEIAPEEAAVVAAPPPPPTARTAEQFDTTTAAQREAATSAVGGAALGETVASLGDPSQPGFWAETPLVDAVTMGRLEYSAKGTSVAVELRPIAGDAGAGSRVSLAAFRALEAPLTGLPTLIVYGP